MVEVVKRPLAKSDLKDIWHYSFNKWGEDQADNYLLQLEAGMQGLASNPNIGKSRDAVRDGYRSIQINRHVIYYRFLDDSIDIVPVLHERMKPQKHL